MFKQKENTIIEQKDKNAGFVDENGNNMSTQPVAPKEEEKNPNDIDLKKEILIDDNNLKTIEDERSKFLKVVKKQNIIKWINSAVSIGLLLFSWLYFINGKQWQDVPGVRYGAGISLVVVSLALLIGYYVFVKKYNDKKMNEYLKVYYGAVNAYTFGNERFKDVHGDIAAKIEFSDFLNSRAFKDVSSLSSRNVVSFLVDGKIKGKICDCAAQKTTVKRLEPLFIGKYIIADNTYNGDDEIIITLLGNSRSLPPNNLDNLPKVFANKKEVIYSNNKNYESVVNSKVRQAIAQLVTNNVLVDVFISVTKGKTYIGLGYDDCLMIVPLQQKLNPAPLQCYKKDMQTVADIIVNLNK